MSKPETSGMTLGEHEELAKLSIAAAASSANSNSMKAKPRCFSTNSKQH